MIIHARSQTLFGNAIVQEAPLQFLQAVSFYASRNETEFQKQVHSQTEFGNELKT